MKQLVEYITGMDTRVGYPNEHLAGDSDTMTASPTFSTAVGLLMNALENSSPEVDEVYSESDEDYVNEGVDQIESRREVIERKSIFEKWTDKFKEFLDKA